MKKWGSGLFWVYSFGANFVTYISGIEVTKLWLEKSFPSWLCYIILIANAIFLLIVMLYCVILAIQFVTSNYRKSIGTHGIPCNIQRTFVCKCRNRNASLLRCIHNDLYHQAYKIKTSIINGDINTRHLQNEIASFLLTTNIAIMKMFGVDLNVNIKILCTKPHEDFHLLPYCHYRNKESHKSEFAREYEFSYLVSTNLCWDLTHYVLECKNHSNTIKKVNSIFNYLLNDHAAYWMSNDLCKDENKKLFYTTSDNFPHCYSSMAVFKIAPPESTSLPKGLLIFDTTQKGVFVEEECAQLMGLVAHLLYELFFEMEKHEKKKT